MNRILFILTVMLVTIIGLFPIHASALTRLDIRINDIRLEFESDPYLEDGTTMVPLKAVTQALGATEILWEQENQQVTIIYGETAIVLQIDSLIYWVNDEERILEVAPNLVEGRTMVPLRMIAQELGCEVNWNAHFNTVEIHKEEIQVTKELVADEQYTYEDVGLLAKIVKIEAYDISFEAKLAVANVILNRKKSPIFPNTIYDVLYDTKYAKQFPPVHKDSFQNTVPDWNSWVAAKHALDGVNNIGNCLFFNHRPFTSRNIELYKVIDGQYFYTLK